MLIVNRWSPNSFWGNGILRTSKRGGDNACRVEVVKNDRCTWQKNMRKCDDIHRDSSSVIWSCISNYKPCFKIIVIKIIIYRFIYNKKRNCDFNLNLNRIKNELKIKTKDYYVKMNSYQYVYQVTSIHEFFTLYLNF